MDACWSCGRPPGKGAFCEACEKLQPQTRQDPFTLLGLPTRFALDPLEIERRFRDLQRKLHPDRFATKSAAERRMSLERASAVNEAYGALRDPVRRAELLIELAGTIPPGTTERTTDPDLLMEVMEIREALEQARRDRDAPKLDELGRKIREERDAVMTHIGSALDGADSCAAASLLVRLRYYGRMLEEIGIVDEVQ